jgi:hypothetical protein
MKLNKTMKKRRLISLALFSVLAVNPLALMVTLEGKGPAATFEHVPASFGLAGRPQSDVTSAELILATPLHGCFLPSEEADPCTSISSSFEGGGSGGPVVLLISRGECNFTQKVLQAHASCASVSLAPRSIQFQD